MTTTIQTGAQNPKAKALLKGVIDRANKIGNPNGDKDGSPCPKVLARVKAEIQKINPGLKGLTAFIGCMKWTFDDKPIVPYPTQDSWEGEANEDGLPKDASLSQKLLEEAKGKCYDAWQKMLDEGAFDGETKVESKPVEKEAEEIDMAELARRQKQKEQEKTVDEVVSDKTPEESEPARGSEEEEIAAIKRSISGIGDDPLNSQLDALVHYNEKVGTPPVVPLMNAIKLAQKNFDEFRDKLVEYQDTINELKANQSDDGQEKPHPVVRLREAVEDIARGVVGPASDSDLQDRIDKIEAKLDELIDFRRETEGKMTKNLSEVVGDIVREKMKGMFS